MSGILQAQVITDALAEASRFSIGSLGKKKEKQHWTRMHEKLVGSPLASYVTPTRGVYLAPHAAQSTSTTTTSTAAAAANVSRLFDPLY